MLALSIRQPYAELILRGVKTCELRSRATRVVGERFYLYASRTPASRAIWSGDLAVGRPPGWMVELAEQVGMISPDEVLPVGVIVGTAVIERVSPGEGGIWQWHLGSVERAREMIKPKRQPQPVWFRPF